MIFKKSLHHFALDESSLSFGRVKAKADHKYVVCFNLVRKLTTYLELVVGVLKGECLC